MANNESKNLIIIDWLQLRFELEIPTFFNKQYFQLNKESFIQYTGNQSMNFYNVDNLFIKSEKVGTIQYNPRSNIIKANMVILKIENELFYNNTFQYYINYIIDVLKWNLKGITRIDIASDFTNKNIISFLKEYYHKTELKLPNYNIRIRGKGKVNELENTMYVGSKNSDKYIKVYNKSKELTESNKRHIKNYYRVNGIDWKVTKIERLELTLKSKRTKNIDVRKLANQKYLNEILKTESKGFFEFYKPVTRKGKKVNKDVTPVTFNNIQLNEYNKVKQKKEYNLNTIETAKRSIKFLYFNNLEHQNTIYLDNESAINRLLGEYDLNNWYKEKMPYWNKEFQKQTGEYLINKLEKKMKIINDVKTSDFECI
jgi:hypothetical protein